MFSGVICWFREGGRAGYHVCRDAPSEPRVLPTLDIFASVKSQVHLGHQALENIIGWPRLTCSFVLLGTWFSGVLGTLLVNVQRGCIPWRCSFTFLADGLEKKNSFTTHEL